MPDHARPLNARGRRSAALVGGWLASRGDVPGEVLCSDSLRTKETWDRIAPSFEAEPRLVLKSSLYHAAADVMLAVLRGGTAPVVMMIGHNPGIADFANRILSRIPGDSEFLRYPTGATAVITFEAETWGQVAFGSGALMDFTYPRRLEE